MTRTLRITDYWPNYKTLWRSDILGKLGKEHYLNLAKVGVLGSNPIARSKILDLIESSPVTTLRAGRPLCRTGCMP
jgi:hypothetical protein